VTVTQTKLYYVLQLPLLKRGISFVPGVLSNDRITYQVVYGRCEMFTTKNTLRPSTKAKRLK